MHFSSTTRRTLRVTLLIASVFAFVFTVSAIAEAQAATWPAGISGLTEHGTMFLTGIVLLGLAFVARQALRKCGRKSAS